MGLCRLAVIVLTLLGRIYGLVHRMTAPDQDLRIGALDNRLQGRETLKDRRRAMRASILRSFGGILRLARSGMSRLSRLHEWTAMLLTLRFLRRAITDS